MWIEILEIGQAIEVLYVTPYGGVWIEMMETRCWLLKARSRLMEACGLKSPGRKMSVLLSIVTPYGGVWIEILLTNPILAHSMSRLMEACGLK